MVLYNIQIVSVIVILVGCNRVTERRHNNCVTWRDDLLTLNITCRVPNLSRPVIIANENDGIQINCSTIKQTPSCYPAEKNISVDLNNHTVSVQLIELKTNRSLHGSWQCKQGETMLSTHVSLTQGIISDSWVNIRGQITRHKDDDKDIMVECSSCRIPEATYVEFLVNNKSYGSMNYDKSIGVCYHKFIKCNPFQCNCSSNGNMFQLRLSLTDDIDEIACEMHFYDEYRKGKFGITSNMKITGNEVMYDASITNVIVKNKYKPTVETISKTVTEDNILENNKTFTSVLSDQGISTSLIILIIVIVPLVIGIPIIVVWLFKRKSQKEQRKNMTKKNKDIELDESSLENPVDKSHSESKEIEETIPLIEQTYSETINYKNTGEVQCEICKRGNQKKIAESFCLNCNEKICIQCKHSHVYLEQLEEHVILPLNELPSDLTASFVCQKHNKKEFTFFCTNHEEAICADCLKYQHKSCQWQDIKDKFDPRHPLKLRYNLHELVSTLENKSEKIRLYQQLLAKSVDIIKSEIAKLREPTKADQKCLLSEMKNALHAQLDLEQNKLNFPYESQQKIVQKLLKRVRGDDRILQFIEDTDSKKCLLLQILSARKNIDEVNSSIKDIDRKLNGTELRFRWTLVDPCLGKIDTNFSSSSVQKNTDLTVASQAPSMTNAVYSCQEKKFEFHISNLAYVCDEFLVLVSNEETKIVLFNLMTEEQKTINIDYLPHDIEVIPNTTRVIVTCETFDKIQEVDLETHDTKTREIEQCAKAAVAITPSFLLLGLRSKRAISVLQHDGKIVLDIETGYDVDRFCYYDDRISYFNSISKALISIDVTGSQVFFHESNHKPVDILATDKGHFVVLEESQSVLRKFTMDGKELPISSEKNITWKDVTAFCSNGDASGLYVLSCNEKGTILSVLAKVKKESLADMGTAL